MIANADAATVIGETINVGNGNGNGQDISIGEPADRILALLAAHGVSAQLEHDSARLRPAASEVARLCAETGKARRRLGWTPAVSLSEGLAATIRAIRRDLDSYPGSLPALSRAETASVAAPRPRLDIVIVNYNAGAHLARCLDALAAARTSDYQLTSVTIVDNASSDQSLTLLPASDLPLAIIRNPANRGFAAACNQGTERGHADLILFLNPDVRVEPEAIELTVAFMADLENAGVGICGGQMLGAQGQALLSCSRFPTLSMLAAKMTGLSRAFPHRFPPQRMGPEELTGSQRVDQVIGAFLMVRRSLFAHLGGFDERFFVYMEEVDFAYRASRAGARSYFLASARAVHSQGVSSAKVGGRRLFYSLRSQTEYAGKHWPRWQLPVLMALFIAVEVPVRAGTAIVRGSGQELRNVGEAAALYLAYTFRDAACLLLRSRR